MSISSFDSAEEQSLRNGQASGVSVVICCYNSENRIKMVLEHLNNQITVPELNWEVLIIDNASKDNTSAVALDNWKRTDVQMKIIYEPEPGLSNARKTGIKAAKYQFISFIDDDNWVIHNWVQSVFEIMEQNPQIGLLGGKGEAVFEGEKPAWFDKYQRAFAVGPQNTRSGRTFSPIYGAGITSRKSAWDFLHNSGFEFFFSGRKGSKLTSGEDSELCFALMLCGFQVYYNENLTFAHYMPDQRMDWEYIIKLYQSFGRTWPILSLYRSFLEFDKNRKINMQNRWQRLVFLFLYLLRMLPGYIGYLFTRKTGHQGQVGFNYSWFAFVEMIRIFNEYPTIVYRIKSGKWMTNCKKRSN